MENKKALFNYLLRLGDNSLILGHRLSELCSKAPFIEEDLALTNIALDMIGRAQALLKYAAEVDGNIQTEDDLAYRRPEHLYFNNLITEQPNGDFAHTIARQFFISSYEYYLYTELTKSKDETLSAIAKKAIKEIKYHLEHAEDWVIRLGDGTEESHARMQSAIDNFWMYTGELFEVDEVENTLIKNGTISDLNSFKNLWIDKIKSVISKATLNMPGDAYMQTGSKKGIHTEHLGHILSEMQYLQRAYPDAKW
jgi:ring-1,2-phenylacetyl-CoA epoxidase subunit PaaC